MREEIKSLVDLLKSEKQQIILHYLPPPKEGGDCYTGIQYGTVLDEFYTNKFNSFPREVQREALKEFINYTIDELFDKI